MKLKRKIKKIFNKAERKGNLIGRIYTTLIKTKRNLRYEKHRKIPVEKKLIIFESFMGRKYTDSPKAIYEYMLNSSEYTEYTFVWAFRNSIIEDFKHLENNERTRLVRWGSDEYYKTYATAGYWIVNTRIPQSIVRKEGQEYIQCWHGTPFKKLGCDIASETTESAEIRKKVMYEDVKRYTYLLSPSSYFTEVMTSALDLNSLKKKPIILEKGYPRNDSITNQKENESHRVRSKLRVPEDKKVILYAPTYREDKRGETYEYTYKEGLDLYRLKKVIGDKYIVMHRSHYYIKSQNQVGDIENFVIDVSDYPEINELYIAADILITDYSSVFFDFGILKKPVLFYMHDLDYYKDSLRGLYLDLEELPGPVAKTQDELEELLLTIENWSREDKWKKRYRDFSDRFTYNEDGQATEKVVNAIFKKELML